MFHVLEHVPDPGALVREVSSVLSPGGQLIFEIPNGDLLPLNNDGLQWRMRSLEDQVHHFRQPGIPRLLTENGFATDDIRPWTMQDAYGAKPVSPRQRLSALVKGRRIGRAQGLLRVVARSVA